ncbi:unnamed protein product [Periconia digitata]|uniref:Uncharacterized protein n=1 Tax=Periconia digitata TaxID=1303443 RepID=A0A9W4UGP4_9PLEO|nr:unnamed protein product [Periconia digitata]
MEQTTMHHLPPQDVEQQGPGKSVWMPPSQRLFPRLHQKQTVASPSKCPDPPCQQLSDAATKAPPTLQAGILPAGTLPAMETPSLDDLSQRHPLAAHPWWVNRPHLLAVLGSQDPATAAHTLPTTSQQQEAMHMLAQRSQRMFNILNLHRGCQKQRGGFPNLE